ncbi:MULTISPECIES: hypothetical protein [Vibrio harveyi group]|uniref:hypothetical protein n=1 Tax=Vibrio harveyi group TaxID=717610 RepID=UPI00053952A0|nr:MULTISPECIES: hypothetical protein [Vibrio harveyi group]AIV05454.1 hypothetical protein LA59_08185 [Vibrio harveyi]TNZ92781.1 hypothetical protein CGK37_11420 [Vibrio parahaemolyticus]TOA13868.1 hypothetical protein CGK34_10955 [Vibrio parahaemolyticus]HBC3400652.1 hypothetical protein [Vibrio parahaemolyticus]HBC3553782.1 hypothetical protein [Vibrio parahaemolyticus]
MLKPVKKVQDSESSHCELTHVQLLRIVGSLDEAQRQRNKNHEYQAEADQRINSIRANQKRYEQLRLESQEEALLEQSEKERKRREVLEQLGGVDE